MDAPAEVKAVVRRITSAYKNLLLKDYDPVSGVIPDWLPTSTRTTAMAGGHVKCLMSLGCESGAHFSREFIVYFSRHGFSGRRFFGTARTSCLSLVGQVS